MHKITDREFELLSKYIKDKYGINIGQNKKELLNGRLIGALIQGGYSTFTDFYNALIQGNDIAASELAERVTTRHTFFMREKAHFDFLRETVLPEFEESILDRNLRIWCAACSSGEEAYTIVMTLLDYFGNNKLFWDTRILATDISEKALKEAQQGIYSGERVKPIPKIWLNKYFDKLSDGSYSVKEILKQEIIFRKLNLMEKYFPLKKKLHVIFCRNVMIYFDAETKNDLVRRFYDILEPGGYLFIGHSESITREQSDFKYILPAVYRKV